MKESQKSKGVLDLFWDAMDSMKFAVILLVILTTVSLVGVLLPQFPPDGFTGSLESLYLKKYGPALGRLFVFLELDHLFTAWWYYILLALLCLNLTFCSFRRVAGIIKLVRRIHFFESEKEFRDQSNNRSMNLELTVDQAARSVSGLLKESGYRVAARATSRDNHLLYARRGELSRFGPFLTHTSMVLIILGAAISFILSFEHFQWMAQDDLVEVPDLSYMAQPAYQLELVRERLAEAFGLSFKSSPLRAADHLVRSSDWRELPENLSVGRKFRVRLEKFQALFTPQGKPKAFLSTVSVLDPEDNELLYSQVIKVNDPLVYGGVYFYQSSYAPAEQGAAWVRLTVSSNDSLDPGAYGLELKPGAAYAPLGGTGDSIAIRQFVGNFKLDAAGQVSSIPGEYLNPAVQVVIKRNGQELMPDWVFKNFPRFSHRQNMPYAIVMEDYQKSYLTGLTIRTHRSQTVIWIGFALMVAGVLLSFYLNHRQVWVMVKAGERDQESRVCLAGVSYKWKQPFLAEFESLANKIAGLSSS
ncbi:MAG TPA: cytochrome c biogenesis protein ResB [archaeon]|nr:cytochrome c biogenesis protein ResB [archaeon]